MPLHVVVLVLFRGRQTIVDELSLLLEWFPAEVKLEESAIARDEEQFVDDEVEDNGD